MKQKLKRELVRRTRTIAKEKGNKAIDTDWKLKLLHDQKLRSQKADVDLNDNHQWLRIAGA